MTPTPSLDLDALAALAERRDAEYQATCDRIEAKVKAEPDWASGVRQEMLDSLRDNDSRTILALISRLTALQSELQAKDRALEAFRNVAVLLDGARQIAEESDSNDERRSADARVADALTAARAALLADGWFDRAALAEKETDG